MKALTQIYVSKGSRSLEELPINRKPQFNFPIVMKNFEEDYNFYIFKQQAKKLAFPAKEWIIYAFI